MWSKPKNRKMAALLAFASAANPVPISGLHKFYLQQPLWGVLYLLLAWTPIPKVASVIEGIWYLSQDSEEFDLKFNGGVSSEVKPLAEAKGVDPAKVGAIAEAVRQLDQLRADGLISEYEFEQKRRQLLERIA
ncbi:SHOCT domain-containing protein [Kovacikia minuta CCNUW1]|uniref:SHOCT domain-containing protein n=1 Tax=Kovacikia minuta TaxID=2931930 RepID=UPI001CCBBBB6|nr:SHOCT domain-containing protein [Kovacikia minuta]UBF25446.1 SHOCT domain-containing protein [Kovacikia minuta CCNUW1]